MTKQSMQNFPCDLALTGYMMRFWLHRKSSISSWIRYKVLLYLHDLNIRRYILVGLVLRSCKADQENNGACPQLKPTGTSNYLEAGQYKWYGLLLNNWKLREIQLGAIGLEPTETEVEGFTVPCHSH
ncbi:MAG: hypothetical protein JWO53_142 [Chlamydiia bacterium]|nr:hypothetical protein [Chlamydiia bacterium]